MPVPLVGVVPPQIALPEGDGPLHDFPPVRRPPWIRAVVREESVEATTSQGSARRNLRPVEGEVVAFHHHVLRLPAAVVVERLLLDLRLLRTVRDCDDGGIH